MCRSAAPKGPAMGHANRDGTRRSSTRPSKPATALRGDPMGKDLILTINPGTTTTRIGLFAPQSGQVQPLLEETVEHDEAVVAGFPSIAAQLEYRAAAVQGFLSAGPGGGGGGGGGGGAGGGGVGFFCGGGGGRAAGGSGGAWRDAVSCACGGDRGERRSGRFRAAQAGLSPRVKPWRALGGCDCAGAGLSGLYR